MNITQKPTPNFTAGRTKPISIIVVHWIVGTLSAADTVFANPNSQVSAHYAVGGGAIHQYVKETDTAWHAKQANPFSIGIEHEGGPTIPITNATYETSSTLIADICKRRGLDPRTAVRPHKEYVQTQCPGTLDVGKLRNMAYNKLIGEIVEPADYRVNDGDIQNYYKNFLGRDAKEEDKKVYRGKTHKDIVYAILGSDEFKQHQLGNYEPVGFPVYKQK